MLGATTRVASTSRTGGGGTGGDDIGASSTDVAGRISFGRWLGASTGESSVRTIAGGSDANRVRVRRAVATTTSVNVTTTPIDTHVTMRYQTLPASVPATMP